MLPIWQSTIQYTPVDSTTSLLYGLWNRFIYQLHYTPCSNWVSYDLYNPVVGRKIHCNLSGHDTISACTKNGLLHSNEWKTPSQILMSAFWDHRSCHRLCWRVDEKMKNLIGIKFQRLSSAVLVIRFITTHLVNQYSLSLQAGFQPVDSFSSSSNRPSNSFPCCLKFSLCDWSSDEWAADGYTASVHSWLFS
jgi:hypothetical protein